MLTAEEKKSLLKLARDSISSEFTKEIVDLPKGDLFMKPRGVFVTLHLDKSLRGCIGFPMPTYTLTQGIVRAAKSAAFDDPRFDELTLAELDKVEIEISVLTPPEQIRVTNPVDYDDEIDIGTDGLIVKSGMSSGLLLPQVFDEYGCTPVQALKMTCQKAGLSQDAWQDLSVKVFKFQAEVFSEKQFPDED